MGSILELNKKEVNCKDHIEIIMVAIRHLDERTRTDTRYKGLYKPDYYKGRIGCGSWKIKRKGMALLIDYFKFIYNNECERNIKYNDIDIEDIRWCRDFCTDVLVEAILENKNVINLTWT